MTDRGEEPAAGRGDGAIGPHPDLGVLFVHGIGSQPQGETVTSWGDVLIRWLGDWLRFGRAVDPVRERRGIRDEGPVRALGAALRAEGGPGHPPHVDVEIDPSSSGEGGSQRQLWRLAESWWADVFDPPGFRELAFWGFAILPWTLVAHFMTRLERAWRRSVGRSEWTGPMGVGTLIGRLLLELVLLLVAVLLSPLLAVLVLLVLGLATVPIRAVRESAARLQQLLSRTVGDSYVLLGSPSRAAAITSRVRDDISAMAGCGRLVVVAHSQGAAVAYEALLRARPDNLQKLITLGSGQRKLTALRKLLQTGDHRLVWLAPLALISLMSAAWYGIERARAGQSDSLLTLVYVGLVLGALLWLGVARARDPAVPTDEDLDLGATLGWLDLYASHDPVSNGPLFGIEQRDGILESREVLNTASTLRDHSSYWRNRDEFVPQVAMTLAAAAGVSLEGQDDLGPAWRLRAVERRRWRFRCLKALRLLAVGGPVALLVAHADRLPRLGRRVIEAAAGLVDGLPFVGVGAGDRPSPVDPWAGAAAIAVAVGLGYGAVSAVWRLWEREDYERFVRREPFPLWPAGFVAGLYATAALAVFAWLGPTLPAPSFDGEWLVFLLIGWIPLGLGTAMVYAFLRFSVGWILLRVGVIRPGHLPASPAVWVALTAPVFVLVLIWQALGTRTPAIVGLVLLAPGVLVFVASLVTSSRAITRLVYPLRRVAGAGLVPTRIDGPDRDSSDELLSQLAVGLRTRIAWRVGILGAEMAGGPSENLAPTLAEVEGLIRTPTTSFRGPRKRIDDLVSEAERLAKELRRRSRTEQADALLHAAAPYSVTAAVELWRRAPDRPGVLAILQRHAAGGSLVSRRHARRALQASRAASPQVVGGAP